jgi:alpha-mannosidase
VGRRAVLEYHRGTYTTNGPIKRANRRNEQALRAAELWSVAAAGEPTGGWGAYPADELDQAWKVLLLNQFHDIIPGFEHPLGQRRLPA